MVSKNSVRDIGGFPDWILEQSTREYLSWVPGSVYTPEDRKKGTILISSMGQYKKIKFLDDTFYDVRVSQTVYLSTNYTTKISLLPPYFGQPWPAGAEWK